MHIYCINMEHDVERRENVLAECTSFGLTPEFVPAVEGKKLGEEELRKLIYDPGRNVLTRGEIGCALSHLKVYEKLLDAGHDRALVLEDDIRMAEDPGAFLQAAGQWPSGNPDVLLITDSKQFRASKGRVCGPLTFFPAIRAHSAHAYVVTREAARNLLESLRPIRIEADYWKHFVMCGLVKVWVCEETPIRQNKERFCSHLQEDREKSFPTPERKRYTKHIRSLEPFSGKVSHLIWKIFLKPFEKIS